MMGIRASLYLLLFLSSCYERSSWQVEQVGAIKEEFSSSRLVSKTKDPVRGLDVELVREKETIHSYLSVHSRHLVPTKEDPSRVVVTLKTEKGTETFQAHLFEGGQKCLLSQEGTTALVNHLKNNQEITIVLNGYRRSLSPCFFEKQYKEFLHPAKWEIPFQFKL